MRILSDASSVRSLIFSQMAKKHILVHRERILSGFGTKGAMPYIGVRHGVSKGVEDGCRPEMAVWLF
jgi:hypothetical protein